jgi:hypothetical protein
MFVIYSKNLSKIQNYAVSTVKSYHLEAAIEFTKDDLENIEIRNLLLSGSSGKETAQECLYIINNDLDSQIFKVDTKKDGYYIAYDLYNIEITLESFYEWSLSNIIISDTELDITYHNTSSVKTMFQ